MWRFLPTPEGGGFRATVLGDVALPDGTVSHIGQQSGKNNIITTLSTDGKDAARIDYKKRNAG